MQSKAKYITVFFQSGYDTTISNMHRENGGYGSSPFGEDRVVGKCSQNRQCCLKL